MHLPDYGYERKAYVFIVRGYDKLRHTNYPTAEGGVMFFECMYLYIM